MIIDYSRDFLLTEFGMRTLRDRYLLPEENSPQEAFARAALAFADDSDHAQRLYDYASKLWFMFSTPILSNGGTKRGLAISCYLNYVPDSREGLTDHYTETAFLSSYGGGVGGHWANVRSNGEPTSKGNKSSGIVPFIKVVDSEIMAFHQGSSRRGSYAFYIDVSHPEIEELINIRKPTGGDINRKALNLHQGVNISDEFMSAVASGGSWKLVDPHSKRITKEVDARKLWISLLETRMITGEPYLSFIDTMNRSLPETQKHLGLKINGSNLCSEITLPTSEDRTAVCCLSSVNLDTYDEWRNDPIFIEDLIRMLDNVISHFIESAPKELKRAVYSAKMERSLGLGAMGFHSYLQRINVPFEGPIAYGINREIFRNIKEKAAVATVKLAEERGSAPDAGGNKIRNLHLLAIAPNASSSIICGGVSPSIEPIRANAFTHKTLSGSFLVKNKYLEHLLDNKGMNNDKVWKSIISNLGSVQHLDFLDSWEKDIFKTAMELDQNWIIEHASVRQEYICQSQSVNLFFPMNVHVKYLHDVHWNAWKKGLKSLYYLRSESASRPEEISKQIEKVQREEVCFSCEG